MPDCYMEDGDNVATADLDELLKDLQRERPSGNSSGVLELDTHLADRPTAAPMLYTPVESGSSRPTEPLSSTARVLASGLTERQRRLPKIDFRMVGGVLAVLVLIIGIGSATILTGESQELRQRAFVAAPTITPIPEFAVAETPTPLPIVEETVSTQSATITLIVSVVGLVLVIGLVAFLFWSFVV